MSDFLQTGLHPDADQLNAFAEHVLPPHEQEKMLAHLAACPDCRTVVSAALPIEEDTAPLQIKPARKPWFSGWNLLWPVAAALAALLPITLYLRSTSSNRDKAAPQNEVAASPPPARIAVPVVVPATAAKQPQPRPTPKTTSERPISREKAASTNMPVSMPTAVAAAPMQANGSANGATALSFSNRKSPTTAFGTAGLIGGARTPATQPQAGLVAGTMVGPTPAPAPPPAATVQALAMSALSETVAVNNSNFVPPEPVTNKFTLSELKTIAPSPLPSGLPILSTTSTGQVAIALDTRNTLFYSNNSGREWKAVPSQWKGRAVQVTLANDASRSQFHGVMRGMAGGLGKAVAPLALDAAQSSTPLLNFAVTGTVTDPTGASIPNALVSVRNSAKQTIQTAKSDAAGLYTIASLAPGTYQIEATAPGFQTLEMPVTLVAAHQNVANLKLQIGSLSQTVTVQTATNSVASGQSPAKKVAPPAAASQPTPLFEITTDSGDHWISFDGLSWAHK